MSIGLDDPMRPGWRQRHRPRFFGRSIHRLLRFALPLVCTATVTMPALQAAEIDITIAAVVTRRASSAPVDPTHPGSDIVAGLKAGLAALDSRAHPLVSRIRLLTEFDDCTAKGGEATAGRIAVRGATLVIGHTCSAAAVAAAHVYARRGILFITPGARSAKLTEPRAGPTVFRFAGRDDRFGTDTANLIASRFHGQRVAIAHDKSIQGRGLADSAEKALRAAGTPAAIREAYVNGEKEYNALVAKLGGDAIQVLIVPAQPIEAGIIFRGLMAAGRPVTLIGSDALAVPDIETIARDHPARVIAMLPEAPAFAGLDTADKSPDDRANSPLALRARAALEAWAAAAARSPTQSPAEIGRSLESEAAMTVLGSVRFDVKGDAVIPSFSAHGWSDGAWRPLQ